MNSSETAQFVIFGTDHILAMLVIVAVAIGLPLAVRRAGSATADRRVALVLGAALPVYECAKIFIRVNFYGYELAGQLPFHLCSVAGRVRAHTAQLPGVRDRVLLGHGWNGPGNSHAGPQRRFSWSRIPDVFPGARPHYRRRRIRNRRVPLQADACFGGEDDSRDARLSADRGDSERVARYELCLP